MSAFLNGRVNHELMASVWPTADRDPDSTPEMLEFARIWLDMPKFVFSRTGGSTDWNTTVVREVVPEEIRRLQAQPGGDMVVAGTDLADTFRRLDLIDEYRLYVNPILLGSGTPMFRPADTPERLRLLETRTFGTGVVLLRYERAEPAGGDRQGQYCRLRRVTDVPSGPEMRLTAVSIVIMRRPRPRSPGPACRRSTVRSRGSRSARRCRRSRPGRRRRVPSSPGRA